MFRRYLDFTAKGLLVLACLSTIGCARLTSIHRSEEVPDSAANTISIDAKQRMILSQPIPPRSGSSALRFCAEPPPDVFTALAASLGAEASGLGTDATGAAIKLATTLSESASSIERTQTVNILRESMYRNCERFLSGAIDEDEFIVQAARDQQLIVQVLAIEQITGASRAQATALTSMARAAASGVTDVGLTALATARKDLDAKRALSDKAVVEARALAPVGPCPATPLDPASPPSGVTAAQATSKNDACATAKVALDRTRESEAYLTTVQDAVNRQAEVSATASGSVSSAALSAAAVSEAVAKQVVNIVKQSSVVDEVLMACIVKLRNDKIENESICADILTRMLDAREAQLLSAEGYTSNAINLRLGEIVRDSQNAAGEVFAWLIGKGGNTAENLRKLEQAGGVRIPIPRLKELADAGADRTRFSVAFQTLSQSTQIALRNAATQ